MYTQAYKKYEKNEAELIESTGFNDLPISTGYNFKYSQEEQEILEKYVEKSNKLFEQMEEDSYKETYEIFLKVSNGKTLKDYDMDWEDFKTLADECLHYDETCYSYHKPSMETSLRDIIEKWEVD